MAARKPSIAFAGLLALMVLMFWLLAERPHFPWPAPRSTDPERAELAHDPRNLPIGRYLFRTPEGTWGGSNGYGGGNFRILVTNNSVRWYGRSDRFGSGLGIPSLQTLVDPLEPHQMQAQRQPVGEVIESTEGVLAHFDGGLMILRFPWLIDAAGHPVHMTCGANRQLMRALEEKRSLDVLSVTHCRLYFRPRPDLSVLIQSIPGARLREVIDQLALVYALVSDSIEDPS